MHGTRKLNRAKNPYRYHRATRTRTGAASCTETSEMRRGASTPELAYLSGYFDTSEINNTFYRHFEPEIAAKRSDAVENLDLDAKTKSSEFLAVICAREREVPSDLPV